MTATGTAAGTRSNETFPVDTLAGEQIQLQDPSEQRYFEQARDRYTSENRFDQAADLRALDRLLFLETLMYRYQKWLASGRDYDGILTPAQEEIIRKSIRETSPMISSIQVDLGLTKSQRDKEAHESVGAYIERLKQAAKAHGIRRERQLTTALDLMNRLFSLVGTFDRSSEKEREKLGLTSEADILAWIRDVMRPEYDAVDQYFRDHEQRFWVGKL